MASNQKDIEEKLNPQKMYFKEIDEMLQATHERLQAITSNLATPTSDIKTFDEYIEYLKKQLALLEDVKTQLDYAQIDLKRESARVQDDIDIQKTKASQDNELLAKAAAALQLLQDKLNLQLKQYLERAEELKEQIKKQHTDKADLITDTNQLIDSASGFSSETISKMREGFLELKNAKNLAKTGAYYIYISLVNERIAALGKQINEHIEHVKEETRGYNLSQVETINSYSLEPYADTDISAQNSKKISKETQQVLEEYRAKINGYRELTNEEDSLAKLSNLEESITELKEKLSTLEEAKEQYRLKEREQSKEELSKEKKKELVFKLNKAFSALFAIESKLEELTVKSIDDIFSEIIDKKIGIPRESIDYYNAELEKKREDSISFLTSIKERQTLGQFISGLKEKIAAYKPIVNESSQKELSPEALPQQKKSQLENEIKEEINNIFYQIKEVKEKIEKVRNETKGCIIQIKEALQKKEIEDTEAETEEKNEALEKEIQKTDAAHKEANQALEKTKLYLEERLSTISRLYEKLDSQSSINEFISCQIICSPSGKSLFFQDPIKRLNNYVRDQINSFTIQLSGAVNRLSTAILKKEEATLKKLETSVDDLKRTVFDDSSSPNGNAKSEIDTAIQEENVTRSLEAELEKLLPQQTKEASIPGVLESVQKEIRLEENPSNQPSSEVIERLKHLETESKQIQKISEDIALSVLDLENPNNQTLQKLDEIAGHFQQFFSKFDFDAKTNHKLAIVTETENYLKQLDNFQSVEICSYLDKIEEAHLEIYNAQQLLKDMMKRAGEVFDTKSNQSQNEIRLLFDETSKLKESLNVAEMLKEITNNLNLISEEANVSKFENISTNMLEFSVKRRLLLEKTKDAKQTLEETKKYLKVCNPYNDIYFRAYNENDESYEKLQGICLNLEEFIKEVDKQTALKNLADFKPQDNFQNAVEFIRSEQDWAKAVKEALSEVTLICDKLFQHIDEGKKYLSSEEKEITEISKASNFIKNLNSLEEKAKKSSKEFGEKLDELLTYVDERNLFRLDTVTKNIPNSDKKNKFLEIEEEGESFKNTIALKRNEAKAALEKYLETLDREKQEATAIRTKLEQEKVQNQEQGEAQNRLEQEEMQVEKPANVQPSPTSSLELPLEPLNPLVEPISEPKKDSKKKIVEPSTNTRDRVLFLLGNTKPPKFKIVEEPIKDIPASKAPQAAAKKQAFNFSRDDTNKYGTEALFPARYENERDLNVNSPLFAIKFEFTKEYMKTLQANPGILDTLQDPKKGLTQTTASGYTYRLFLEGNLSRDDNFKMSAEIRNQEVLPIVGETEQQHQYRLMHTMLTMTSAVLAVQENLEFSGSNIYMVLAGALYAETLKQKSAKPEREGDLVKSITIRFDEKTFSTTESFINYIKANNPKNGEAIVNTVEKYITRVTRGIADEKALTREDFLKEIAAGENCSELSFKNK